MAGTPFEFSAAVGSPEADGRIDAPAFRRNHAPIWAVLSRFLARETGDVLEIGSGTGQHIVAFARETPALTWWPSDPRERHRRSIAAWRTHASLTNVCEALDLDLAAPDWGLRDDALPSGLTAIFCANVVHVAPWNVSQGLFGGAAQRLRRNGRLFLYGPFMRDGVHTAPSNVEFDADLRRRDPDWGVRDIESLSTLAHEGGLRLAEIIDMPANNFILAFEKDAERAR